MSCIAKRRTRRIRLNATGGQLRVDIQLAGDRGQWQLVQVRDPAGRPVSPACLCRPDGSEEALTRAESDSVAAAMR